MLFTVCSVIAWYNRDYRGVESDQSKASRVISHCLICPRLQSREGRACIYSWGSICARGAKMLPHEDAFRLADLFHVLPHVPASYVHRCWPLKKNGNRKGGGWRKATTHSSHLHSSVLSHIENATFSAVWTQSGIFLTKLFLSFFFTKSLILSF